jgi:outer membrane protein, heavy metal efflux system
VTICISLLLLTAFSAAAQESPPPEPGTPAPPKLAATSAEIQPLTLSEALSLADQYSPQLKAAQAQIAGATAGIQTASAYPNPAAVYLGGHQYARPRFGAIPGTTQHFGLSQPIDLPNRRQARIEAAKLSRRSTEFGLDETRLEVQTTVKQAFYEVLRRKGEYQIAQDNLRLVEDLRRRIQVKVDVGESGKLELIRADAELATVRAGVKSSQLRLVTAISALRAAIGVPLSREIDVEGVVDPRVQLPPLNQLRELVFARHPSLKRSGTDIEQARAELRSQRVQRVPEPSVEAEYEPQPDLRYFRVGLTIPLPVWNQRQGQIGQAQAAINRVTATNDIQRLQLTNSLESAFGQYEVADQQVQSFESGALREANAAVTAAQAAYKSGERGIIDVLDAQRVLRSVRLDYLNAQFDRQAALIELQQLRAVDVKGNTP